MEAVAQTAVQEAAIDSLPLSPEQHAAWTADGAGVHLLTIALPGQINERKLHDAICSAVAGHESLRHAFRPLPGYRGLRQYALERTPPLNWREVDVQDEQGANEFLAGFANETLNIADGDMLHAALIRIAAQPAKLAIVVSKLVSDRMSLQTLYEAIAAGYNDGAPDASDVFQYGQFVEWRQELADDADSASGRTYWTQYMTNASQVEAPRFAFRQNGKDTDARRHTHAARVVDADLHVRMMALCDACRTTPEIFMQAIWWLLLAKISGQQRFIGGWQHDCRRDYDVMRGAVGCFDKVLPVMIDAEPQTSFAEWLACFAENAAAHVDAQEHWTLDAAPVASHLVAGFAFAEQAIDAGGWRIESLPGPARNFELALQAVCGPDGSELSLQYLPAHYSLVAASLLLEQYVTLLGNAVGWPDTKLAALSAVGAAERAARMAMNDVHLDVGRQTVAEHIGNWASVTPDAPAIEADGQVLSYAHCVDRANRMAHWLRAQGIGPGKLVALNLPRSAELLVAMLAVWRVGAAWLPVEPEWPDARRRAVFTDAQPTLILQRTSPVDAAAGDETELWREASLSDIDLDRFDDVPLPNEAALNDIAYVLYTSGSTGTPKGAVIEHGQLLNYVSAASAAMHLEQARRWALTSSVAADLGHTALFGALFNGACLVIANATDMQDGDAFARFLSTHRIDGIKIVPSHLEALLECEQPYLPRKIVLGGEAASRHLIERIRQLAPECALHNHYGPTETTIGVMVHAVDGKAALPDALPLTSVLPNNHVHVLDSDDRLMPTGAVGELHIGGAQLFRGYLNRDVGNALIDDPFRPGQKLYRSGDLACVLPEGGLRIVGRADDQLKIRGFRVEPAEIVAALLTQPGIRHAQVLPLPSPHNEANEAELVAFVTGDEKTTLDTAALRTALAAVLPSHMMPTRCIPVSAFPRLANGKIDRATLRALAVDMPTAVMTAYAAPRDALEFALADGMARLLGREALGINDDFFDAGGHSLQVIKLVARIRKLLKVEIAPAAVFDHPTAVELAQLLRTTVGDTGQLDAMAEAYRQSLSPAVEADGAAQPALMPT